MTGRAGRCPDRGACHHECGQTCFRVRTCGPLSGVFPGDEWPEEVRRAHTAPSPAPRPARIQWRVDGWWGDLVGRVGAVDLFRIHAPTTWTDGFVLRSPLITGEMLFPFETAQDGPPPKGLKAMRKVLESERIRYDTAVTFVQNEAEETLAAFARSVLEVPQQKGS